MADRKQTLRETLRQRILSMEMAPGAIIDEVQLSEEFGLSRPPLREMMREMAAEGYIELEPNRPARVSPMSHDSLRSFFRAAPMIYVATAQLAAAEATAADVARVRDIQSKFRSALKDDDTRARVMWNERFHHEIGVIARNVYLLPSLRRVQIDHARLGQTFYRAPTTPDMQRDLERAATQHDEIIDAMERRDPERAGTLMSEHFAISRRRMAEYVTPASIDVPIEL